jgi:hypothetical protein
MKNHHQDHLTQMANCTYLILVLVFQYMHLQYHQAGQKVEIWLFI